MSERGQEQDGSPSADAVAMIEAALAALRRDPSRRRGPWGQHGPWAEGASPSGPHGGPWSQRGGWGAHPPAPHGREPYAHDAHDHSAHDHDHHGSDAHDHGDRPEHDHAGRGHAPDGDERPVQDDGRRGSPRGRDAAFGRMARFRMLEALEAADSAGRPLSVSTLAAAIGVDQPRASRLVQEGVERGHVRRVPDPSDARRALLELTKAGRSQLSEVRSHRRSAVEAALADFTTEEAQTFATLLTRFAQSFPRP